MKTMKLLDLVCKISVIFSGTSVWTAIFDLQPYSDTLLMKIMQTPQLYYFFGTKFPQTNSTDKILIFLLAVLIYRMV